MADILVQQQPEIVIYPATALGDVNSLDHALESTVRDASTGEVLIDEIKVIKGQVQASKEGIGDRYYAIAGTSGGAVLGVMGLSPVDSRMSDFVNTANPVELVNACVSIESRGLGVGGLLLGHLLEIAKVGGFTGVILNSGPRYKEKGWPFWTKSFGEPVGDLPNFYGEGVDAKVWRSELTE